MNNTDNLPMLGSSNDFPYGGDPKALYKRGYRVREVFLTLKQLGVKDTLSNRQKLAKFAAVYAATAPHGNVRQIFYRVPNPKTGKLGMHLYTPDQKVLLDWWQLMEAEHRQMSRLKRGITQDAVIESRKATAHVLALKASEKRCKVELHQAVDRLEAALKVVVAYAERVERDVPTAMTEPVSNSGRINALGMAKSGKRALAAFHEVQLCKAKLSAAKQFVKSAEDKAKALSVRTVKKVKKGALK